MVSQICCIYFTYPSGWEFTENRRAKNLLPVSFKADKSDFYCQLSQFVAAPGFLLVRGPTPDTCLSLWWTPVFHVAELKSCQSCSGVKRKHLFLSGKVSVLFFSSSNSSSNVKTLQVLHHNSLFITTAIIYKFSSFFFFFFFLVFFCDCNTLLSV